MGFGGLSWGEIGIFENNFFKKTAKFAYNVWQSFTPV